MEFWRQDREEARAERRELIDEIKQMRGDLHRMETALSATTNQVAQMALEKCGVRLDALEARSTAQERKIVHFESIFGAANKLAWKVLLWLGIAAISGGGVVKVVDVLTSAASH